MSIPYRITTARICRLLPSTSWTSTQLSLFPRPNASGGKRCFSSEIATAIATELQGLPIVLWFRKPIGYVRNWVENAGLNDTALEQLDLYTWWKPSSWYRVVLESLHTHYNLSWLSAIVCATIFIRVATVYLPVLIFWRRTRMEQPEIPFFQKVRSKAFGTLIYSSSAGIFLTQYCALKKMAEVVYPNWPNSGVLSFVDLTVSDPYFVLPILTAAFFTVTSKKWVETCRIQRNVSNWMFGLSSSNAVYPIAAGSFFIACNVPSAICISWIASSLISGLYASVLSTSTVHSLLRLPSYGGSANLYQAEMLNYINGMRRKREVEVLEVVKKTVEVAKKNKEVEIPEVVEEVEDISKERDSLFRESWIEGGKNISRSKILQLMEEQKKEAALRDDASKASQPKSIIKSGVGQFEIDKIVVGGD